LSACVLSSTRSTYLDVAGTAVQTNDGADALASRGLSGVGGTTYTAVTASRLMLPLASRAVTVMRLMPGCSATTAFHRVVPAAVPLAPRLEDQTMM
jgi:hypothetical protein